MENNRNSEVLNSTNSFRNTTDDLRVPSGFEVESATLIMPVSDGGLHSSGLTETRGGFNEKLESWKSKGLSSLHSWKSKSLTSLHSLQSKGKSSLHSAQHEVTMKVNDLKPVVSEKMDTFRSGVTQRVDTVRSMMTQRVATMRDGVNTQMSSMHRDMSSNPAKWAGIAAGAGMVLGVLGRYMRHRAHRPQPQVIIVGAGSC